VAQFRAGDRVHWRSHGGEAVGVVIRRITEDTEAAGRQVRASESEPQYLVRSDKSGGEAVHHPHALRKITAP
jgi:Hypervirulence associated proteins TUDOR domain